jgi:hypothetical protein
MLDKRRHLGHDFCLKIRKERCPQSNRLNDQSLVHFNTFQQDSIFPKVTDLPISALLILSPGHGRLKSWWSLARDSKVQHALKAHTPGGRCCWNNLLRCNIRTGEKVAFLWSLTETLRHDAGPRGLLDANELSADLGI